MQHVKSTAFFCLITFALMSCSGLSSRPGAQQNARQADTQNAQQAATQNHGQDAKQEDKTSPNDAVNQLIDTAKLKSDMNNMLNSIASGKPDTNLLKMTAKDVLSTTHDVLSDSGIDKLYGNSNDPAVKAAAEMLKKYRNGMGVTPAALDSIKKAAESLKTN